jgi:hypothetical protein
MATNLRTSYTIQYGADREIKVFCAIRHFVIFITGAILKVQLLVLLIDLVLRRLSGFSDKKAEIKNGGAIPSLPHTSSWLDV